MFGIYIIGIAVAMALSKLLRITALKGDDSSFLIELPPYRLPRLRNVLEQISVRAFGFIKKAGTIILAMSVILWAMSTFPEKKFMNATTMRRLQKYSNRTIYPKPTNRMK